MNVAKTHYVISLILTGALCTPVWAREAAPAIEVFTDSKRQVISGSADPTVYVIDGILQLQQALSRDLPNDPAKARQLVLGRFRGVDTQLGSELENAAKGLVQAMRYSIDRYPAIVFDGSAVVYGVTDLDAAAQLYQRWQHRGAQ